MCLVMRTVCLVSRGGGCGGGGEGGGGGGGPVTVVGAGAARPPPGLVLHLHLAVDAREVTVPATQYGTKLRDAENNQLQV